MHIANSLTDLDWLQNALSDYLLHPFIMITLCLLSVFVVLGNLLVVSAIWHEHQLHSVTNYLIASLAAADCLVGAVVMPFSIISEIIIGSWTFGETWCDLWHSFDVLASTASIMNLCAISLDRYLAITDPISYPARMTPKRVALLIVSLWTSASLISFPAILWWRAVGQGPLEQFIPPKATINFTTTTISPYDMSSSSSLTTLEPIIETNLEPVPQYRCVFTDDPYYLLFSSFISFYGPLCVMLYAYIRIYKAAVQQTRFLKYGSKQVVVGKNKKKQKSKHISEQSSYGANEKHRLAGAPLEGATTMESYDRQHLVLRAHRGGGGGSSQAKSTRRGSINDLNTAKSLSEQRKAGAKHNSKTLSNAEGQLEAQMLSESLSHSMISSNDNSPLQLLKKTKLQNHGSKDRSSDRGWRDKLKVNCQRFDSKPNGDEISVRDNSNNHNNLIQSSDIESNDDSCRKESSPTRENYNNDMKSALEKSASSITDDRYSIMYEQQQQGKPLLAYINNRSTSIDVSIVDYPASTKPQQPIGGNKGSCCINFEQDVLSSKNTDANQSHKKSGTVNYEDEILSDDELVDSGSTTTSSDTYGTGSIASVMFRPQGTTDENGCDTSSKQLANNPKMRRALSYGETRLKETMVNVSADEFDENEVLSSLAQEQIKKQHRKYHRASCGDQSFNVKRAIIGVGTGNSAKVGRTLNIRSWMKLTRTRQPEKADDNMAKLPPSLMPLMMMNSDTSTDSSVVSSVIRRVDQRSGKLESKRERTTTFQNDAVLEMPSDDCYASEEADVEKLTKVQQEEKQQYQHPRPNNHIGESLGADEHIDKSLTFEENLEKVDIKSKGQMLYYNSEKLIQSIVDLRAIHYIDCANQNSKNPEPTDKVSAETADTKVEQESNRLDLEPTNRVQNTVELNNRPNNIPRQHRKVGKKLTKLAKERKAAKTLGIVVGVFILCWLPFFVINIVVAVCGTDCIYKIHIVNSVVTWLGWLNSAMNPVIYACWSRDFRRAFRRVLCTWVEFICPYDEAYLARKLRLKKSSNYSAQEAYFNRTASSIKGNTSSATVRSVGLSTEATMNSPAHRAAICYQIKDSRS